MTHMNETTIRVLKALERHRRLDPLQAASVTEVPVSAAESALSDLEACGLVHSSGETRRPSYALDQKALSEQLQVA